MADNAEASRLPISWCRATLAEIAMINPTLDKKSVPDEMIVSFVPMPAVGAGTGVVDTTTTRKASEVKKGYTPFREGDVLFAKITPCMENGKMAVVPALKNGLGFGSTEFHVLRSYSGVSAAYVYYFVSSEVFRREAEHNMSGAVGQRRVTTPYLTSCEIALPPTNEQFRIVAKIEELFSELDQGIENLKTARAQLKVYRHALLKHAFEGKLTAQWRADNPDKLESGDALLKRIQKERDLSYKKQLSEWEAGAKAVHRPKPPKVIPNLTDDETANLSALPKGWCWTRLGQLTWSVRDGPHFSPKYVEEGIPFISGGNVRPNGVEFRSAKYISRDLHEELSRRCKPEKGDLLYTKGGTTGIARVNTYDLEFNVWVHIAVLKLTNAVKPFFVQHALNSSFCYAQAKKFTHGVGNQDLGLTRMVNIVLAMCSPDEQEEVIQVVDDRMSVVDQLDDSIGTALQQSVALRQSILKRAFSGQLVPQDASDEPAAALLERIRAEKAAGSVAAARPHAKAARKTTSKAISP